MGGTAIEASDLHSTTAQQPAGKTAKSSDTISVLLFVAVSIVSFVVCLARFAIRQIDVGVGAASVMLLASGASLAWRATEARRVRQLQRDWNRAHHVVAA
jgi:hypothetical protein